MNKYLRFGMCIVAAMMVVVTCCGMQAWHFCSGCSHTAQPSCCGDCNRCADCANCGGQTGHPCWYFHADLSPSVAPSVQAMPAPHETVAWVCLLPISDMVCRTAADDEPLSHCGAPPLPSPNGRNLLLRTAKLTL